MRWSLTIICVLAFEAHALLQEIKPQTQAQALPETPREPDYPFPYAEAKAGYFFFFSSTMNNVYDKGGIDVQLSGGYPLARYLRIYGSVEYFEKSGHSQNGDQKTSFWAVPFSVGLQPVFRLTKDYPAFFYFTIGPRYYLTRVHNHTSYISSHMHKNGWGGFANVGLMFQLYKGLTLDIFTEGSYARLHYSTDVANSFGNTVQIGGLASGAGLAYAF